jgi:hypothetical protein
MEPEFYNLERFSGSLSAFLRQAYSYQLYFNLIRENSAKGYRSPDQLRAERAPTLTRESSCCHQSCCRLSPPRICPPHGRSWWVTIYLDLSTSVQMGLVPGREVADEGEGFEAEADDLAEEADDVFGVVGAVGVESDAAAWVFGDLVLVDDRCCSGGSAGVVPASAQGASSPGGNIAPHPGVIRAVPCVSREAMLHGVAADGGFALPGSGTGLELGTASVGFDLLLAGHGTPPATGQEGARRAGAEGRGKWVRGREKKVVKEVILRRRVCGFQAMLVAPRETAGVIGTQWRIAAQKRARFLRPVRAALHPGVAGNWVDVVTGDYAERRERGEIDLSGRCEMRLDPLFRTMPSQVDLRLVFASAIALSTASLDVTTADMP